VGDEIMLDDEAEVPPATLEEAARMELEWLWADLYKATRRAANGEWSIECNYLRYRIGLLTPFVGPTPYGKIQIPLLESGVYQRIHKEMGMVAEVDTERVAKASAYLAEQRKAVAKDRKS